MEGPGSEAAKRQRLDPYNASQRMQQQPPMPQSHGYSGNTLPPPNSYVQPTPIPQSPYHEAIAHEHRNLPDPTPHSYVQAHSGHNTPIRDHRSYPPDAGYSRRGSASGATRSPDEYPPYAATRPLNSTAGEGQHFAPQYLDQAVHLSGYPTHEGSLNGNTHHGLPMSSYHEQNQAIPQAHAVEYSQSPVNTGPHSYGGNGFGAQPSYAGVQRPKKGNRAQQACDVCRAKKAKCDEARPECGSCVEARVPCNYQTVVPAKADRANQAIMDQLTVQNEQMVSQKNEMQVLNQTVEARLDRIERLLSSICNPRPAAVSSGESPDVKPVPHQLPKLESPKRRVTGDQKAMPYVFPQQPKSRELRTIDTSPSGSHMTTSSDSNGGDIASLRDPSTALVPELPIAIEHNTAAHRLLRWPSINALVKQSRHASRISVREDYVMEYEEMKGVLRVYGRGQGRDFADSSQPGGSSPAASSTSARSEDNSEARSPASPPEGLWGTELDSPKNYEPRITSSIGGLDNENHLRIDPKTLRRLLSSYLDNIHILHPFLDKSRLTRMFERFSTRYNPSEINLIKTLFSGPGTRTNLDGLREPPSALPRAGKRKHSDEFPHSFISESPSVLNPPSVKVLLERSPSTAIVLLVLALGKICEWKDALPGPVPDEPRDASAAGQRSHSPLRMQIDSPPPVFVRQSPSSSLRSTTNAFGLPPTPGIRLSSSSPRSLAEEYSPLLRNIDVIPGLAYYAKATDILGNVHGGNDLANVQANLLAGLYASQLARTFESWTWIHSACRACRFLVRDPTLAKERDLARRDLIKFAFWTCSQLESDILAELDLPRSGIQDIDVEYPKGFTELADFENVDNPGFNTPSSVKKVMDFYSFQIHIRNSLNNMQKDLYPPENREPRTGNFFKLRSIHEESLRNWRQILPPWLQWDDDDEPAADINNARLRAKYYGALYIIHRPFLRHVLDTEVSAQGLDSPQVDLLRYPRNKALTYSAQSSERGIGTMPPPRSTTFDTTSAYQMEIIIQSAKICIKAAMQSTIAFDNIINHQRLIVTNIFGTAHAQFGNILVLAATYRSSLSYLIPAARLEHLFDRTIKFLGSLRPISDTLAQDVRILQCLKQVVFDDPSLSFSSDN